MALLRPCGRVFRTFSNSSVSCQIEYIRGVVGIARAQGYVTLATEAACPNTSIEKFDSTKNHQKLSLNLIVPKLNSDVRKRVVSLCRSAASGKKINEDLLELLESLAGGKIALDESVGLALLRNCSDMFSFLKVDERMKLTNLVWETVSERSSGLSLDHYNALLRVHVENRQSVEPRQFFNTMTVKPDETTYRLLLRAVAQKGEVESAAHIISTMKNAGFALDEDIFNFLIEAHANTKDIESALSVLRTMKETGIQPSAATHANIAFAYVSVGDIKNTLKILDNGVIVAQHVMEIVKRASAAGYGKHLPALLKYLPSAVNEFKPECFNTMQEMVNNGYPEDALEFIKWIVKVRETDLKHPIFESFLRHIVYSNVPSEAILKFVESVLTDMKYPFALSDVSEAALQTGRRDLAMAVFEMMHDKSMPVRPHYYWPLLIQSSRSHNEADVFRIIKHMLCLNVPFDHGTLLKDIIPYISTVNPVVALRKLNDVGLEISQIFTPLICYLLYQGRLKEALTLCYKIKARIDFSQVNRPLVAAYKCRRNVIDCAKMFKFAPTQENYPDEFLLYLFGKTPKARDLPVLDNFRRVFKSLGIPLLSFQDGDERQDDPTGSKTDEVTLVDPFYESRRPKVLHPAEMTVEELECHLIELKAKGMNERGVLRRLIQLHCREKNIDRVEKLKKEFEENGFPWTPGMYSSLIQLYSQSDRAIEALNLYRHIQKNYNDFKIDDFKILLLATALIQINRISDAIELLETNRSSGGQRISQDCWRLLNAVVHSPNSELTSNILDILVSSGFCEKNNALLGPLVREHLLKNDLEAAVDTFRKCAERYNHFPLRQELINALVTSTRTDESTKDRSMMLLEQVQGLCVGTHGSRDTNVDLAIALARNGLLDDLRRFFKQNHIPNGLLMKNLKLLPEQTEVPVLTAILDVTTEESGLNRISIYEYILSHCNRAEDCELAIETRRKLLADTDVTESEEFRQLFFNLLKTHKVPLPEDFVEKQEV